MLLSSFSDWENFDMHNTVPPPCLFNKLHTCKVQYYPPPTLVNYILLLHACKVEVPPLPLLQWFTIFNCSIHAVFNKIQFIFPQAVLTVLVNIAFYIYQISFITTYSVYFSDHHLNTRLVQYSDVYWILQKERIEGGKQTIISSGYLLHMD